MKITRELDGLCSTVYLVKIKNTNYVLKQCDESEVVSEKAFYEELAVHNIGTLAIIEHKGLKANEILLEYIEGSKTLYENFTELNCEKWGKVTRKIHDIKFEYCFKYNKDGEINKQTWASYLESKIEKAFLKAKENNNYGFNEKEVRKIEEYLEPLRNNRPKYFSLIHGDLHSGNMLIKDKQLIPFDKNPETFTGDALLDIAIAMVEMPNGTLIHTDNPKDKNDKKYLNAFIKGYKYNFLNDAHLDEYIMLIAFGRLYTPFAENHKEIIYSLLKKDQNKQ